MYIRKQKIIILNQLIRIVLRLSLYLMLTNLIG
nr:MAG TPA: hypothetical protein [Caudoviricetes sp.]